MDLFKWSDSNCTTIVGEEILCFLHDAMIDGGSYKFKVIINVESLEE